MADRPLSTHQIKNRKRVQSGIAQTTGALGLGALGAFGASKLPGTRVASKIPKLRKLTPEQGQKFKSKAENASLGLSTAGAGIGGAGSFNFASYTRAEADKKKVRKSMTEPEIIPPVFGETGRRLSEDEINKAYDPEGDRLKRADAYKTATDITTGGLGYAAGHQGVKAAGKLKPIGRKGAKSIRVSGLKGAAVAGGLGAAAVGSHMAGKEMKRRKGGSWSSYT